MAVYIVRRKPGIHRRENLWDRASAWFRYYWTGA